MLDNRSFLSFVNESSMSLPPLSPVRVAGVAKNNHHHIIVSSTTNKNIIKKLESKYITEYPKGTPFIVACEKGNIDDVKAFVNNNSRNNVKYINQKGRNANGVPNWSGLNISCIYERYEIVKYLLQQPLIDISIVSRYGNNAFHFVSLWNKDVEILKLLLSHTTCSSKMINCQNDFKKTPLDCSYDNPNFVKKEIQILLINNFALNGFQMDQERQWEEEEERKRMQYFKQQNVQDAKQTIHKLKQKYLKRYPLGTPFIVACEKGNVKDVKSFVKCYNIIDYKLNANNNRTKLLKNNIKMNQIGKTSYAGYQGKSGLIAACGSEHKHVVSFLLKQPSIDISQTDKHGWNALHWATQFSKKSPDIVIALLNHSTTNINVINQQEKTYGFTPLDKAYRRLSKLQQTRNRTKQDNEEHVIYHIINAILLKGGVSIIHH